MTDTPLDYGSASLMAASLRRSIQSFFPDALEEIESMIGRLGLQGETAYDALFSAYNKLDQGYDLRKVVAWVEWESKPLP
jgi:hypothetical protein